jgi:hypothetical protein
VSEIDIRGRELVEALVETIVIVVIDEGVDLGLEITGWKVVLQQDTVLQGLMPVLNLTLGLRVTGCTTNMIHMSLNRLVHIKRIAAPMPSVAQHASHQLGERLLSRLYK